MARIYSSNTFSKLPKKIEMKEIEWKMLPESRSEEIKP